MSSAYWRKSQPNSTNMSKPDSSKLYQNVVPLYPVRVIHSAPPTQKTSFLHHSRLHINRKIPRGSSFSSITPCHHIIERSTYIQKSRHSLFISNDVEISVLNIATQSRAPFHFLKSYWVGDNMPFFSAQKSKPVHIIFPMSFLPQASKLIGLHEPDKKNLAGLHNWHEFCPMPTLWHHSRRQI
jgi:hypothetical protein